MLLRIVDGLMMVSDGLKRAIGRAIRATLDSLLVDMVAVVNLAGVLLSFDYWEGRGTLRCGLYLSGMTARKEREAYKVVERGRICCQKGPSCVSTCIFQVGSGFPEV